MKSDDNWTVKFTGSAKKQKENLPPEIRERLYLLELELKIEGPEQPEWRHFGKIKGKGKKIEMYHCHLNAGRPVYVAVWKVTDTQEMILEVRYVGTHENADYRRIS